MHEQAFQALKRTFLNVSGLPHHILIKRRTIFKVIDFFLSKRLFRPSYARLCMSQVFPHHILI